MSTADPGKPASAVNQGPPAGSADQGAPQGAQAYTASPLAIHIWGASGIAEYWMWKEFAIIPQIFNVGFGIDPRTVGWAMALPRLLDSVVDPIVGHISDNLRSRWGRRRPFMFATSILGAALVIGMYWVSPNWPGTVQFIYLLTAAVLYYTAWGTYSLTRNALSYELSDDYNVRSRVMAIGAVWFAFPSLLGSWTYWMIAHPIFGDAARGVAPQLHDIHWFAAGGGWANYYVSQNVDNVVAGVHTVTLVCAGLILLFGLIPTFLLKERFQQYNRKTVNLWKAIIETLKNKPFVLVILFRVAETLSASLYGALSFYIGVFYLCRGDKLEYSAIMTAGQAITGFLVSLLVWPLAAPVTRKIGKRWGLILGYGLLLLWAVTLPFVLRPGWVWVVFIQGFLFLIPFSMKGMFTNAVMPDICDVDELKSGERREGLYSAVFSFINKVEISVCALLGGYVLVWAGYNSEEVAEGILPSQEVLHNMLWWGFTPLIFFALVAFIITFFLPLTPQVMAKVHAELEARRAKEHLVANDQAGSSG